MEKEPCSAALFSNVGIAHVWAITASWISSIYSYVLPIQTEIFADAFSYKARTISAFTDESVAIEQTHEWKRCLKSLNRNYFKWNENKVQGKRKRVEAPLTHQERKKNLKDRCGAAPYCLYRYIPISIL